MAFPSPSSPSGQDAFIGYPAVEEFTFDFELSPYDWYTAPGELGYQSFPLVDQIKDDFYDFGRTSIQSGPTAQTTLGSMPLWPLSSSSPSYKSWSPSSPFGTNSSVGPSEAPLSPEWLFQSALDVECQLPQAESEIETFRGLSPDSFELFRVVFVDEAPSQRHDFIGVQPSLAAPNSFSGVSATRFDMFKGDFVDESPISTPIIYNSSSSAQLAAPVQQSAPTNARFQCTLCSHCELYGWMMLLLDFPTIFSKSYNLRRHMNTKHAQNQLGFTCSYCPKTMSRADNMKQHEGTCRKRPTDAEGGPSSSSRKGSKPRRERPTGCSGVKLGGPIRE